MRSWKAATPTPFTISGRIPKATQTVVRAFLPEALEGRCDRRAWRAGARWRGSIDAGLFAGALPNGSRRYQLRARFRRDRGRPRRSLPFSAGPDRFRSLSAWRRHPSADLRQAWRALHDAGRRRGAWHSWCSRPTRAGSAWSAISISGTRAGIRCGCAASAIGSCSCRMPPPAITTNSISSARSGQHLPLKSDPMAFRRGTAPEHRIDRRSTRPGCRIRARRPPVSTR